MKKSVLYMVIYGPDASHLTESAGTFKLKCEAIRAFEAIAAGCKKLLRLEFEHPLEPATRVTVLKDGQPCTLIKSIGTNISTNWRQGGPIIERYLAQIDAALAQGQGGSNA